MKVVLLRVGIDTGSGGILGPIYSDGSFTFVPMQDGLNEDERTYDSLIDAKGRRLIDYFPKGLQGRLREQAVHVDPEFETFTYGDPTSPKRGLRRLQPGDLLVFYAGLSGWESANAPALYIVGYFKVQAAGFANQFSDHNLQELFAANFHVRNRAVFEAQKDHLLLIKGGPGSKLLKSAVRFSTRGEDVSGRPLHVISPEMTSIFGDFGGRSSFQRCIPGWVVESHVDRAARYIESLN